jgi:glutaredoxin
MLTLFHHPFCPHSRFVRLVLEELGLPVRLVEERVWERREEFLMLNPAGTTPVLVEEGAPPVLPQSFATNIAVFVANDVSSNCFERRLMLTPTTVKPSYDASRSRSHGDSRDNDNQPVRICVTCEGLWALNPSMVRYLVSGVS